MLPFSVVFVTVETLQTHCYTTGTVTLLWKRHQTHCYATHSTGDVTLLWQPNMSQYQEPACPSLWAPHVTVDWLDHVLCIREVPVSNLGPDTGYCNKFPLSQENSRLVIFTLN
jgi:hypothetical protein